MEVRGWHEVLGRELATEQVVLPPRHTRQCRVTCCRSEFLIEPDGDMFKFTTLHFVYGAGMLYESTKSRVLKGNFRAERCK